MEPPITPDEEVGGTLLWAARRQLKSGAPKTGTHQA
jgi:hypothetical protein